MSALQHLKDYFHIHFAGHDVETLMAHFETAVEVKIEAAIAEVKADFEALRDELMGGRSVNAQPVVVASAAPDMSPGGVTMVGGHGTVHVIEPEAAPAPPAPLPQEPMPVGEPTTEPEPIAEPAVEINGSAA